MLMLTRTPTPTPMTQVVVVEKGGARVTRAVVAAGAKAAAGLVVDKMRETLRVRRQTRAKHLRRLRTSRSDYH